VAHQSELAPSYHARLQEALILEPNLEKARLLAELLETEAQREYGLYRNQQDAYERLQGLSVRSAEERYAREAAQYRHQIAFVTKQLWFSNLINVLKWGAPAGFVILLARWMVHFYGTGANPAAQSIREILILMIGGALGWVAQAGSEVRALSGYLRPPDPQVPKTG